MKSTIAMAMAVLVATTGLGCQDNWQSFYILDNKRLGDPPGCTIPTDENAEGQLRGFLDVNVQWEYVGYLFVRNGLLSREDYGLPRAESNGIFVQGAYLYFEPDPNVRVDYPPSETRFASFIPPQGDATLGMTIIPYETGYQMAQALAASGRDYMNVLARVQLYGVTQGGVSVLTEEFQFPIFICAGCLTYCPHDADATTAACECGTSAEELPCHPGQDDLIDLCAL